MKLIDTHCHLNDQQLYQDLDNVICRALQTGIEKSKKTINDADVVIVVLDGSNELDDEDKQILEYTKELHPIVVYNKSDLASQGDRLSISALNNNIEPLIKKIKEVIGLDEISFSKPALNNARQIGLLKKAKEAILKAKQDAENDLTIDLVSVSLLEAYTAILEILGEANQMDLAKEIFSRFCVGK